MKFKTMWGYEVADEPPVRPGIRKLRGGGYLIDGRAKKPGSSKRVSFVIELPGATLAEAQRRRDEEAGAAHAEARGTTAARQRFRDFATSLFEAKAATIGGDLQSAAKIEQWEGTLRLHLFPMLGAKWCDELSARDVGELRREYLKRLNADPEAFAVSKWTDRAGRDMTRKVKVRIAPATANGWLDILRVISKAMTREFGLAKDPCEGLEDFPTETPYTEEEPNALSTDHVGDCLEFFRETYPQHYAMVLLLFYTGLRISHVRPLRRNPDERGERDVDWSKNTIRIRRSNSRTNHVMRKTKTKASNQTIELPPFLMQALRAHVMNLPDGPMTESILLFPSESGGMRARSVLDKPLAHAREAMGVSFRFTVHGMRRSFNDLMRVAGVDAVIKKSIAGHVSDQMSEHYQTVRAAEKGAAIATVHKLVTRRAGGAS